MFQTSDSELVRVLPSRWKARCSLSFQGYITLGL
jgi:hypothetical protein